LQARVCAFVKRVCVGSFGFDLVYMHVILLKSAFFLNRACKCIFCYCPA